MATPTPKSYDQILGDMIATYTSKIGIDDLNTGSAMLSFMESVAQAIYRAQGDIFAVRRDYSVDRATGEALKRLAAEERVTVEPATFATGYVTITDSSFDKISTKVYAGSVAPNVGTTSLNVSDASAFPSTGSIYIGRGTPNIEGPIAYSSKTQVGGYWVLSLTNPTQKYHNNSETIILAQGGVRNIPTNTIVVAPASGGVPDLSFRVTQNIILLDGENVVNTVPIAAQEVGSDSNIPKGAIKRFSTPPFTGAIVTNTTSLTNGKNEDTDDEIRAKIKRNRISKGLGTKLAIKNSTIGVQATDEVARVVSNEIFDDGDVTTLFIDDGTGYEEKDVGVGLEYIVDSAIGGENRFQLVTGGRQTSVTKAYLKSSQQGPYAIQANDRLSVLVAGVLSEHVFQSSDFRSVGYATPYEIVASINSNSNLLYYARTSDNGTKVIIEAKSETIDAIQLSTPTIGNDAGQALTLQEGETLALRLYKNNKPLSNFGQKAIIETTTQSEWSNSLGDGETLIINVDNTQDITYTIGHSDFINEGTYPTLNKFNSLQSWVNVLNKKIIGVTASINGNRIDVVSNLGQSSRASIVISPSSSLVSKGVFSASLRLSSEGNEPDYTFSRNTAQFKLNKDLEAKDVLTAGTDSPNAELTSGQILGGSVTIPSQAKLWFLLDDIPTFINHFAQANSYISVTKIPSDMIRYTSSISTAFLNILPGDYVIIWSNELNTNNRLEGRVMARTNNSFDLKVTPTEYTNATTEVLTLFQQGIQFYRHPSSPTRVLINSGTYTIANILSQILSQLSQANGKTTDDEYITLSTKTLSSLGRISIVAQNSSASIISLPERITEEGVTSHSAYISSELNTIPTFIHDEILNPTINPTSFTSLNDIEDDISKNDSISFLHPYLTNGNYTNDAQANNILTQLSNVNGTLLSLSPNQIIRLRNKDRFFVTRNLDFSHNDSFVVVLDEDPSNKTFTIPLYRRVKTNTTATVSPNAFRAYDQDGGDVAFTQFFPSSFSFNNYKVLMQSKCIIDPNSNQDKDAIIFRSALWGQQQLQLGYILPSAPNQSITHTIQVDRTSSIKISLKSSNPIANQIDGTTQWDVTVNPNFPNATTDEVTFTYNSLGTPPAMATLAANDVVTINSNGEFDVGNQGVFKVISATSNSFTVHMPTGIAQAQTNVATLTNQTISLFQQSPTTAQEIVDYVNNNLQDYITASILPDNGTDGSGVINTSTYQDNSFANEFEGFYDGVNYILSTQLSAIAPNPQFTLKYPLSLSVYHTNTPNAYQFNNSEEIRFIPTTPKQVVDFTSILAVSGITTLGDISTANNHNAIQISSQTLGSTGAVQVTGGSANLTSTPVVGQSSEIDELLKISVEKSSIGGLQAGNIIKLVANNIQKKKIDIDDTSSISFHSNTIIPGKTVIELHNKDLKLYFSNPNPTFRDVNRAFHVEKHGLFTCLSWDKVTGANPNFSKEVNFNNVTGNITVSLTSSNQTLLTSSTRNFAEVSQNDTLSIMGFTNDKNNGVFRIINKSSDNLSILIDTLGVPETTSIDTLDMAIYTSIEEGDYVHISSPFATLNQGKFRVIRCYKDSIYYLNPNSVNERVVIPESIIPINVDNTTSLSVLTNPTRIVWDEIGTMPDFFQANVGDYLTIGTAFNILNRGTYSIQKISNAQKFKFQYIAPSASQITGGQRIHLDLPSNLYYGWYNLNLSSTDPAPMGRIGTVFNFTGTETSEQIASIVQSSLNTIPNVTATVLGDVVTVEYDVFGTSNAQNIDTNGQLNIIQYYLKAFVEISNPTAIPESNITVTNVGGDVFKAISPSIKFTSYETTIQGDVFTIDEGDNKGQYVVQKVLDNSRIVVDSLLQQNLEQSLADTYQSYYVNEEYPYVGFKEIYSIIVDPANAQNAFILFNTSNQYTKINEQANTQLTSTQKLNFPTFNKKGLDAYKYNIGLIGEVNRVIYGDPRDNTTYPGVAAAGAEIYTRAAQFRRIQTAIAVRVRTGIPFARVVDQVRSSVASLINSTPIGQSIAISDIISNVNIIPGVVAVSISFPNYSPSNDTIAIGANEKPLVIDQINDIVVSKVGV